MFYFKNFSMISLNLKIQEVKNLIARDIAQLGRAPALGAGCRRFKSYYPEDLENHGIIF